MPIIVKEDSRFGAPGGVYQARFLGDGPMKANDDKPKMGRDGRPMPPGRLWELEITEGEHKGKIVSRITAMIPTAQNSCGTILDGIVGRTVAVGEKINTDDYIGRIYTVTV